MVNGCPVTRRDRTLLRRVPPGRTECVGRATLRGVVAVCIRAANEVVLPHHLVATADTVHGRPHPEDHTACRAGKRSCTHDASVLNARLASVTSVAWTEPFLVRRRLVPTVATVSSVTTTAASMWRCRGGHDRAASSMAVFAWVALPELRGQGRSRKSCESTRRCMCHVSQLRRHKRPIVVRPVPT
jgi:hypothetical protein